jgi:hypothetical protein
MTCSLVRAPNVAPYPPVDTSANTTRPELRYRKLHTAMYVLVDLERANEALIQHSIKIMFNDNDVYPWRVISTATDTPPELNNSDVDCPLFGEGSTPLR